MSTGSCLIGLKYIVIAVWNLIKCRYFYYRKVKKWTDVKVQLNDEYLEILIFANLSVKECTCSLNVISVSNVVGVM